MPSQPFSDEAGIRLAGSRQPSESRGWWVMVVWLLIAAATGYLGTGELISNTLQVPEKSVFQQPRFRWIQQDYIEGVCAANGALAAAILCVLTWNRYRQFSFMASWFTMLGFGPTIAQAGYIWLRCDNLLGIDPAGPWTDYDDYQADPWRWCLSIPIYVFVLIYVFIGTRRLHRSQAAVDSRTGTSRPTLDRQPAANGGSDAPDRDEIELKGDACES